MAVSKRTRYEVLRRDNHACRYCGGRAPDVVLTVDHVVPVALGGSDDPSNLVAACKDCNAGKTSVNPDASVVEQVSRDALRWAAAMKLAGGKAEVEVARMAALRARFREEWDGWTFGARRQSFPLPEGWEASVDRWFVAGLSPVLLDEAIRIAMHGPAGADVKFRYLAGVVKNQLAEITGEAVRLLEAQESSATEVAWIGLAVGPGGCGHCWSCRHGEGPGNCALLQEVEEDSEGDTPCRVCGRRDCAWEYALGADGLDEAYEAFLAGRSAEHGQYAAHIAAGQALESVIDGPATGAGGS